MTLIVFEIPTRKIFYFYSAYDCFLIIEIVSYTFLRFKIILTVLNYTQFEFYKNRIEEFYFIDV